MTTIAKERTWLHSYILSRCIVILDLSRKTGIHERTLHYYLRGWRKIPRRHVDALAKVLRVSPRLIEDERKYTLEPSSVRVSKRKSAIT